MHGMMQKAPIANAPHLATAFVRLCTPTAPALSPPAGHALVRLLLVLAAGFPSLVTGNAESSDTAQPPPAWAALAKADIEFSARFLTEQSVMALYPDPVAFDQTLASAGSQARTDLAHVQSREGYRQAVNHFLSAFGNRHTGVIFRPFDDPVRWPGFAVVYQAGHFKVGLTQGAVLKGADVSACDGVPLDVMVSRRAPFENILRGLDSTRAAVAPLLLEESAGSFVHRPRTCVVAGTVVPLHWQTMTGSELARAHQLGHTPDVPLPSVTPFGQGGDWVRIPRFEPAGTAEAEALRRLSAAMPALRNRRLVVFDVRGNTGGRLQRFEAILRSLYGAPLADPVARATFRFGTVSRVTPAVLNNFGGLEPELYGGDVTHLETDPMQLPVDGRAQINNESFADALAAHRELYVTPEPGGEVSVPSGIPSPVRARVVVVVDSFCVGTCVAFLKELHKFPGVVQVGVDSGQETRTGNPVQAVLPSGLGTLHVPGETRSGDASGDYGVRHPDVPYPGDMTDTPALMAWIETTIH